MMRIKGFCHVSAMHHLLLVSHFKTAVSFEVSRPGTRVKGQGLHLSTVSAEKSLHSPEHGW